LLPKNTLPEFRDLGHLPQPERAAVRGVGSPDAGTTPHPDGRSRDIPAHRLRGNSAKPCQPEGGGRRPDKAAINPRIHHLTTTTKITTKLPGSMDRRVKPGDDVVMW
jgi:hypothetical protein